MKRYKDGNDHIGAHRDDEKDLAPDASIASLSFGQPRDFVFKPSNSLARVYSAKNSETLEPVKLELGHGSLLLMNPPTNNHWLHLLPIRKNVLLPRLNLTFRKILNDSEKLAAELSPLPTRIRQKYPKMAPDISSRSTISPKSSDISKSYLIQGTPKIHKFFED